MRSNAATKPSKATALGGEHDQREPEGGTGLGRGGDGQQHQAGDHQRDRHLAGGTEPLTQQPGGQHGGDADARRKDPFDGEQGHHPGGDRGQNEPDEIEPGTEQVDGARQDVPHESANTERVGRRRPDLLQHRSDGETRPRH